MRLAKGSTCLLGEGVGVAVMGFPLVPLKFCQYNPLLKPKETSESPLARAVGGVLGVELLWGRALAMAHRHHRALVQSCG